MTTENSSEPHATSDEGVSLPHRCSGADESELRELYRKTFEVYRDYLKHENVVINNRLTWNSATQGVLFASMGVILNGQTNVASQVALLRGKLIVMIPMLGLLLSAVTVAGVIGAGLSARAVQARWEMAVADLLPNRETAVHWTPALLAGGSRWAAWLGLLPAGAAGVYGVAWAILLYFSLCHS